jgi:hypothetical protein
MLIIEKLRKWSVDCPRQQISLMLSSVILRVQSCRYFPLKKTSSGREMFRKKAVDENADDDDLILHGVLPAIVAG